MGACLWEQFPFGHRSKPGRGRLAMQLSQPWREETEERAEGRSLPARLPRSFPLEFASKYYPLRSLLSPITGSLSAHLIHRQPVAQPSVLFGRCQAVWPSGSSRIRRPLSLSRRSAGTQNSLPHAWKLALGLCWAPSLCRNFLLSSSTSESDEIFRAQPKAHPPPGSLPRMLPNSIYSGRLNPKHSSMPWPHIYFPSEEYFYGIL